MTVYALDLETNGLDARFNPDTEIWYVGLYDGTEYTIYESVDEARHILNHPDNFFIIANASFDAAALQVRGVEMVGNYDDICLMSYVLAPDSSDHHSLNAIAYKYLGRMKKESPNFSCRSITMLEYLKVDLELTWLSYEHLLRDLKRDQAAYDFYIDVELPYVQIIIEMERNGIGINREAWAIERDACAQRLTEYRQKFSSFAGYRHGKVVAKGQPVICGGKQSAYDHATGYYSHCELDWLSASSPKDKLEALYKACPGVEFNKTTAKGNTAVDKYVLAGLAPLYELPRVMLKYNKEATQMSNFLNPIEERTRTTNVLRCNFNQTTTRSGRLSSSGPNLQNIPSRDERIEVRKMFIPENPDDVVVCGDLDRIEVCVFAFYLEWLFGYTKLADAVRQGVDVHSVNAALWRCERYVAKTGIFLLIYGGGAGKLAVSVDLPLAEAEVIFNRINREIPIKEYRDFIVAEAIKSDGIVHDLFGRRFYIPEVLSKIKSVKAGGERKCGNYPCQGTAGSAFKVLQLRALPVIRKYNASIRMAVHDELICTAHKDVAEEFAAEMTAVFTADDLLAHDGVVVPIRAKFHVGESWYAAKPRD